MIDPVEEAKVVLAQFEIALESGHPELPPSAFSNSPDLASHILGALHEFVRIQQAHAQSRPARRVSLTEE